MSIANQFQKVFSRGRTLPAGLLRLKLRRSSIFSVPPGLIPVCEAVSAILVILALGAALPGQAWGMADARPHPLWVVVLAIAVRYGAAAGYLAGGSSALTYGLLLWTRPEARFQPLAPHDLIQPLLMFTVGAILGELVDARERRMLCLESRQREAQNVLEALGERHRTVEKVRTELEKQIAFQSNSVVILSTFGKRLQSLKTAQLHSAIVDLLATALEAGACSLYLLAEGQLSLQAARREPSHSSWQAACRAVDPGHPLIQQVLAEGRVVTIRERLIREGCVSLAGEPILMAGPLTRLDGQVYGVVAIEAMPFMKLTPASIDLFAMILDWASAALANALLYEQALESSTRAAAIGRVSTRAHSICTLDTAAHRRPEAACVDVQLAE
jgi:hypothetical protein